MSNKQREVLEKFVAVDLSRLKFPLDGDSSAIYNSDKKEIAIPYWRVAELLNEVKVTQDMAKTALAEPLRNCDVGTAEEQTERFKDLCRKYRRGPGPRANCKGCPIQHESPHVGCTFAWAHMLYEKEGEE